MQNKQILITAHAGCMGTEPNTINSILAALECNADIIELDICSTKDEVVILRHDSSIKISDVETKYLDEIDINVLTSYLKNVVKLEQALELIKKHNKVVNLDLKSAKCIHKIVELIKKAEMENNIIFSGCGIETAKIIKSRYPYLKCLLNVEDDVSGLNGDEYSKYLKKLCEMIKEVGCDGINISYKNCTYELVEYAHLNEIPVYIWTVDEERELLKFINMKVDSITTHNVKLLKQMLEK